ncbi:MAG: hypothetical protein F4122_05555, partial [Gammaproteobacteria bacterium]|nr:hypothetical protein [Gammaproteobacteria bacterium]
MDSMRFSNPEEARMRTFPAILALCLMTGIWQPSALAQDAPNLDSEDSQIAYAIGMNVGMNLVSQGLLDGLDSDIFLAGVTDSFDGDFSMTMDQMFAALEIFQQRQQELMEQQAA